MECDANNVVAGTVVGTKSMPTPVTKWIKIPSYAVLIEHPERRILFDLGVNPATIHPPEVLDLFPYYCNENQRIENQLALVGLRPEDVSTVVLSHLHFDHCGNIHLFDHADIYFNPLELTANPNIPPSVSIKKPHSVEADMEIVPGVQVITLRGHTAGLIGLVVRLKDDGTLVFTSDAIYAMGNYGPPARPSGAVYDSLAYYESIEKVRRLEATDRAKVMFSHDMEFFETMKKAPDYYK
jgi:glyoxylase-like metal-dependent hydrolase (beta-lactamase superfamily II)